MPTATMLPLKDYDIDPKTGFLPSQPPLRRLPDTYFKPWEDMMDDFNGLLLAGKLRERVHKMPLLDHTRLGTVEEYRRAFLILSMLSHSYVWGKHEKASETLPSNLAIPWTAIADHLGVRPVVCHAAVVLWNFRLLDSDGPIDLSNLAALATYSGSLDEAWFYLVTTAIESAGAPCMAAIMSCIEHIRDGNKESLQGSLTTIHGALQAMNDVFQRMYEKCDPYVFYWKIRPYLAGWENMAEAGLPLGLIYEGVHTPEPEPEAHEPTQHDSSFEEKEDGVRLLRQYRRYAGGSAAQSSLIAALDVALGVDHHPTGEKPQEPMNLDVGSGDRYRRLPRTQPADDLNSTATSSSSTPSPSSPGHPPARKNRNAFLCSMRKYMPEPHRRYLHDLDLACNIRPFMKNLQDLHHVGGASAVDRGLVDLYNDCLHQLQLFRNKHMRMVGLYIVNQARKGPNISHGGFAIEKRPEETAKKELTNNALYPQTAMEAAPGLREGTSSAKISALFPELGLAKHADPKSDVVRGTGGTNVLPFLKQTRDETSEMKLPLNNPTLTPDNSSDENIAPVKVTKRKSFLAWLSRK